MKITLIAFLLIVSSCCFGQDLLINNNAVTIASDGDITTGGYLYYLPAHTKCTFRDSAVVITAGTNVQVTNASDSLYREREATGVNWLRGDTAQILTSGGYFIFLNIRGYGNNGADWRLQVATKTGGSTAYSEQVIDFTTTGATNKNGGGAPFYMEFDVGDKVYLTLSQLSGSGNITLETSTFNILMYYAE